MVELEVTAIPTVSPVDQARSRPTSTTVIEPEDKPIDSATSTPSATSMVRGVLTTTATQEPALTKLAVARTVAARATVKPTTDEMVRLTSTVTAERATMTPMPSEAATLSETSTFEPPVSPQATTSATQELDVTERVIRATPTASPADQAAARPTAMPVIESEDKPADAGTPTPAATSMVRGALTTTVAQEPALTKLAVSTDSRSSRNCGTYGRRKGAIDEHGNGRRRHDDAYAVRNCCRVGDQYIRAIGFTAGDDFRDAEIGRVRNQND